MPGVQDALAAGAGLLASSSRSSDAYRQSRCRAASDRPIRPASRSARPAAHRSAISHLGWGWGTIACRV